MKIDFLSGSLFTIIITIRGENFTSSSSVCCRDHLSSRCGRGLWTQVNIEFTYDDAFFEMRNIHIHPNFFVSYQNIDAVCANQLPRMHFALVFIIFCDIFYHLQILESR